MKSSTYQIVERSSFLYDCIQKDYILINKVCLLCAKNDKISKVNKLNQDYDEDYEDNGDYENNDNIFINYNKNKNIKINIIDDINNEEYKSFKGYIYPECTIFIRNSLKKRLYFLIFTHYFGL